MGGGRLFDWNNFEEVCEEPRRERERPIIVPSLGSVAVPNRPPRVSL